MTYGRNNTNKPSSSNSIINSTATYNMESPRRKDFGEPVLRSVLVGGGRTVPSKATDFEGPANKVNEIQ